MNIKTGLFWAAVAVAFFGAGCSWFSSNPLKNKNTAAGPRLADFTNLDSAQAAAKVNFVPGSQIEIRQTYLGSGAQEAEKNAAGDKDGVRIVTIERFAPMYTANVAWKLSRSIDTQKSSAGSVDSSDAPQILQDRQTAAGNIEGFDLSKSHGLYLPAYWPTNKITAAETGGIWISEEVFEELTKTHNATVYYNILNSMLYGPMSASKDFTDQLATLQTQVNVAENNNTEVDLVKSDAKFSDWKLLINGHEVTVQVFKARNWYGEMVILNNPQNPLILKFTYDPQLAENAQVSSFLKTLLSYEVTSLEGVQ